MKAGRAIRVALCLGPTLVVVAGAAPPDTASVALPELQVSASDAPAASVKRRMQDTVTVMRGITVEGARATAPARVTATTTRLDRASIARFLPSTPTDAMVNVPGVDLIKTGPWASRVSFRGFQGERVLVMVDGVRLNTGRGHGSNTSLVSVDRLDEVDLTAGSGGSEYGSDAMGGVINLVTHRPLFSSQHALTLTISARGSSPGDEVAQSERLKLVTRRFGAELSAGNGRLRELVTPAGRVPNSGSRDDDLGARAAVRLGEGSVDLEYTRHAAHDVGLPAIDGRYPLISRSATRAELEMPFLAAPFGWGLPAHARLLAVDQDFRTRINETTVDTVYSQLTKRPIAFNSTFADDRITTRSRGIQPQLSFGQDGELRLSGELRREQTSGPKTSTVTTTSVSGEVTGVSTTVGDNVPHARRDVVAGAVSSRLAAGPLRIEGGARYDWLRSRADSTASSWSSALDVTDRRWSVDGGLALHVGSLEPYGRIATGFRAPNLEERYFRGPVHGGMLVFGEPSLVPERNVTYEAGIRADADGWGSARVSAYRVYAEDFIGLRYIGLFYGQTRFRYENLSRVQIDGLEFSGRGRWRGASITLSTTVPRGRDLRTGRALTDIGVTRFSVDLATPVGRWLPTGMLAVRARWSNGVEGDPLRKEESRVLSRPAFWTTSTELAVTVLDTRATLAVRNLLDNRYRESLSFVDEPGRTFSFALKRDFQLPIRGAGGAAR